MEKQNIVVSTSTEANVNQEKKEEESMYKRQSYYPGHGVDSNGWENQDQNQLVIPDNHDLSFIEDGLEINDKMADDNGIQGSQLCRHTSCRQSLNPTNSTDQTPTPIQIPTATPSSTQTPTPTPTPTPPVCPIFPPLTNQPITLPAFTFRANCDFWDYDLYSLICIPDAFTCAFTCAADWRCTHFTYIANLNGGTGRVKRAVGFGGSWATDVPAPSPYFCGYIPIRAFNSTLLNTFSGQFINVGIPYIK